MPNFVISTDCWIFLGKYDIMRQKIGGDKMEWIFDGIGSTIISFLLSFALGGTIGYQIGINKNNQKQKARDNSTQIQIGGNNKYGK